MDGLEGFVQSTPPQLKEQQSGVSRVWSYVHQICTEKVVILLPEAHISICTCLTPNRHERERLERCLDNYRRSWPLITKARLSLCKSGIRPGLPVCVYLEESRDCTPIGDLLIGVEDVADYLSWGFEREAYPPTHISIYNTMHVHRLMNNASVVLNEDRTGFKTMMDANWLSIQASPEAMAQARPWR
jgi:hypothetical protein